FDVYTSKQLVAFLEVSLVAELILRSFDEAYSVMVPVSSSTSYASMSIRRNNSVVESSSFARS
ncbi:hypothetical protein, partial [Bacillus alkalicola]